MLNSSSFIRMLMVAINAIQTSLHGQQVVAKTRWWNTTLERDRERDVEGAFR